MLRRLESVGLTLASLMFCLTTPTIVLSYPLHVLAQATTSEAEKAEAEWLLKQGDEQQSANKPQEALQSFQQALKVYQEIADRQGQGQAFKRIGNLYLGLGENDKAIAAYQEGLTIAQAIKDHDLESRFLHNLGNAYKSLKDVTKSIDYYQRSLSVSQNNNNFEMQGITLSGLGTVYTALGDFQKALEFAEKSLEAFRKTKNPDHEASSLRTIAAIYSVQGDNLRAIKIYEEILNIQPRLRGYFNQLGQNKAGELLSIRHQYISLFQIAEAYNIIASQEENYSLKRNAALRASQSAQEALTIIRSIDRQKVEARLLPVLEEIKKLEILILFQLGDANTKLGNSQKAIDVLQQAITIAKQHQELKIGSSAIGSLALIYFKENEHLKGVELAQELLKIAQEQNSFELEDMALGLLALGYGGIGEYRKQIEVLQQKLAKQEAVQIQDLPVKQRLIFLQNRLNTLSSLSNAHRHLGEVDTALKIAQECVDIAQTLKEPDLETRALIDLASLYILRENPQQAIELSQRAITIAKQNQNIRLQAEALDRLSEAYTLQEDELLAIEQAQQALAIAKKLVDSSLAAGIWQTLGNIYTRQGNYPKAIEARQQQLAAAEKSNSVDYKLLALQLISDTYLESGDTEKAYQYIGEVIRIAKMKGLVKEQIIGNIKLAQIYSKRGELERAVELGQTSLKGARQLQDRYIEMLIFTFLAETYVELGEYRKAIEIAGPALVFAQQFKTPQLESLLLIEKGTAHGAFGDYQRATELIQQGLKIAKKKYPSAELTALSRLTNTYINTSNYSKALELAKQSFDVSKKFKHPQLQAAPLLLLGDVYLDLGDYSKSIELYKQALPIYRDFKDRWSESLTLLKLGYAYYNKGNTQEAVKLAQRVLDIQQKLKRPPLKIAALRLLSYGYGEMGNYEQAIAAAQESLTFARKTRNSYLERVSFNLLGSLYRKFGYKERALEAYQSSLIVESETTVAGQNALTYAGFARIYQEMNLPEIAIIYYKQAINEIEQVRRNIEGLPYSLQSSFLETTLDFGKFKRSDIYRQLADLLLQEDRVLEAQQVLELLKVQEFEDSFKDRRGKREAVIFRREEVVLLEKFKAQRQGAIAAAQELKTLQNKPEAQLTQADRDRIVELGKLQEELRNNLKQFLLSKDVQALIEVLRRKDSGAIDPETLQELRNKFSNQLARLPNTALLYPLILEDRLELILITAEAAPLRRRVEISRPTLNKAISDFNRAVQDRNQNPRSNAQRLYDILIRPIAEDLEKANIQTLLYSPDRRLRYVPLAALYDGKNWLGERFQISYITAASVTDLSTTRQSQLKILAGAISDNPNQRYVVELSPSLRREFGGLPNVIPEVTGIAAKLPNTRKLLATDFTEDTIKALSSQYNIIHFATHGSFELVQPEQSFILFGGESSDGRNYATLRDIGSWKLDTDLVVLSACETGLADAQFDAKADDNVAIMGLGYQFEQAGARATIASLWLVNDASTSLLMQLFYKNLSTGEMTKAEALRKAQIDLIQGRVTAKDAPARAEVIVTAKPGTSTPQPRSSNFSHPYYWAPFILIGNSL